MPSATLSVPPLQPCKKPERPERPEDMSIAIEVKFLICYQPSGGSRKKGRPGPPIQEVAYIKDAKSVSADDREKLWKEAFSSVAHAIKRVPGQKAITAYELKECGAQERSCWATTWIVKDSKSAEPDKEDPDSSEFLWVPVEINSPKMAWKDPSTLECIETVLKTLRTTHHIVTNYSCEVHIHMGREDGKLFLLPSVKRMAILMWMAEPTMRKVKDPQSPNFDHTYTWSFAQRDHSRLARTIREEAGPFKVPQEHERKGLDSALMRYLHRKNVVFPEHQKAIGYIWGAISHKALGRLLSGEDKPHRRLGYNFSVMGEEDERARKSPKTIECRFLEGIIEENLVIGWITIYGTMVEAGLTQHQFAETVLRLANEDDQPPPAEAFRRLMADLRIDEETYRPIELWIRKIHNERA